MSYILGLDLGTTSTAAAVNDGDSVRIFTHPSGETAVPSVLALDESGTFLIGEAAIRHGSLEPEAVAREFKRRFGDTTPLLLRGTPVAANDLTLQLAQSVVDVVSDQIGERPERVVVCHPANWGQFKLSLLSDTLANSSLPPHELISEPQAAAVHYAGLERVADQTVVAVYDLGGGTFDVAVLRKDEAAPDGSGWVLVGRPGGIERLGGIDFDTAIFAHVLAGAGVDLDTLDDSDAATQLSVARLREACAKAKVVLSGESSATVAVSLPGVEETVRITRAEFEAMIGPAIDRTLETLDVTLANADMDATGLDRVLLVGGSSRIPLIGQRLIAHTGRPVTADAHPKNAIALGAATTRAPQAAPNDQPLAEPPHSGHTGGHTMVLTGDVLPPPQPLLNEVPPPSDPVELPRSLGTNFPAVPHMADEPPPEFLSRRQGSPVEPDDARPVDPVDTQPIPAASPAPAASNAAVGAEPATQPLPDLQQSAPPRAYPAPAPPTPHRPSETPARGHKPLVLVGALLLMAVSGIGGYLLVDRLNDADAGTAITVSTTATTADDPGISLTSATTAVAVVQGNCSADEQPEDGRLYRVVEIPADDPDGGLNARREPSLDAEVILVFSSQSPVKITGEHCEIDDSGRTWWGASSTGELVWVASNFLEPLQ